MSQGLLQSICGFAGKEKAAKAAEKDAAKYHFSVSSCVRVKWIYQFAYLRICVKCICLFVDFPVKKESSSGGAAEQAAAAQDHFLSSNGNSPVHM